VSQKKKKKKKKKVINVNKIEDTMQANTEGFQVATTEVAVNVLRLRYAGAVGAIPSISNKNIKNKKLKININIKYCIYKRTYK
jgi:hypothetical protein